MNETIVQKIERHTWSLVKTFASTFLLFFFVGLDSMLAVETFEGLTKPALESAFIGATVAGARSVLKALGETIEYFEIKKTK